VDTSLLAIWRISTFLPLVGAHRKSDGDSQSAILKIPAPLACYWLSQSEHDEAEKTEPARDVIPTPSSTDAYRLDLSRQGKPLPLPQFKISSDQSR